MKFNTYLAEHFDTPWPVASGQGSFPYGALYGAGVCVVGASVDYAGITSLKAVADEITVTLCVKLTGVTAPVVIGTVSVKPRDFGNLSSSYGEIEYTDSTLHATAWIAAGTVVDHASFTGLAKLDSSCVLCIPYDCAGNKSVININNTQYQVPECLSIAFTGYFEEADTLPLSSTVKIEAFVPANGAVLSVRGPVDYNKVTGINEVLVVPREDWGGELKLTFEAADGTSAWGSLSASVDNAVDFSDADESEAASTDVDGKATILTLHGNHNFPNCYADLEDEA